MVLFELSHQTPLFSSQLGLLIGKPLQLQPFFPTIPWQLPFVLIMLGLGCLVAGVGVGAAGGFVPGWRYLRRGPRLFVTTLFVLGVLIVAFPYLWGQRMVFYALYLMIIGRVLTGAIAFRALTRLYSSIRGNPSGRGSLTRNLKERLFKYLLTFTIVSLMVVTAFVAIVRNPLESALFMTAVTYTIGRFGLTAVTTIFVTRDAVRRFGIANSWAGLVGIIGIVLVVSGAEVFDFPAFLGVIRIPPTVIESPTGEFAVRFAGSIAYVIGAILGLVLLILTGKRTGK